MVEFALFLLGLLCGMVLGAMLLVYLFYRIS
jgi:hypothetical protein